MGEPMILFVKPKAISRRDKSALQTAGVIVIEIDDPASAKFVRAGVELEGSAMLLAAITAIKKSEYTTKEFGRALCAAIEALNGEHVSE